MKTNIELLMELLSSDGWATCQDGEVDSPTGWFAVVPIDGSEVASGVLDDEPDLRECASKLTFGTYAVVTDSQGFTTVGRMDSFDQAMRWFGLKSEDYADWLA